MNRCIFVEEIPDSEIKVCAVVVSGGSGCNLIGSEHISELHKVLDEVDAERPDAVVFRSSMKHFSGGADLYTEASGRKSTVDGLIQLSQLLARVRGMSPVTAAVAGGAVFGAAAGLVSCCQLRIGFPHTVIRLSSVEQGFPIDAEALAEVSGMDAAARIMKGIDPLPSEYAYAAGFLTHLIEIENGTDSCIMDIIREALQLDEVTRKRISLNGSNSVYDWTLHSVVKKLGCRL